MERVFHSERAAWKISFNFKFRYLEQLDEYLMELADVISAYELSSKNIEPHAEDAWCYDAFFTEKPLISEISTGLSSILPELPEIILEQVEDKDWVYDAQRNFTPIITEDFFIASDFYSNQCPKDKKLIHMNPGRAFGTGDHATTQGCISSLTHLREFGFDSIADIGCGTGVLAIAAAQYWPQARIEGCDIEAVAAQIACDNALQNHCDLKFKSCDASTYLNEGKKYDLILANILARPLIELAPIFEGSLRKGGFIILSGFLQKQLAEISGTYYAHGFSIFNQIISQEWVSLTLKK